MNLFLYVLLIFFYFVSKIIGLRLSSLLGGIIVYCYGIFSQKNSIGIKNLTIVFPEKTLREKKAILGKMWFHFGRVIGEYAHLDKINFNDESVIKIEKIENLLNPIQNGNCIFFSAHIGNWELSSHPLVQNGFDINFIYRPPNNHYVDNLLKKIRKKYGVKLIKKGNEGAKECIRVLKKKGNLGMLIDQKMNDGIKINFFGKEAMTATAIAKLALKFKSTVIPAYCVRVGGTNFKIKYFKPILYEKIRKLKTEKKITIHLNKYIEEWIKEYPEQWIWIHNRWKN